MNILEMAVSSCFWMTTMGIALVAVPPGQAANSSGRPCAAAAAYVGTALHAAVPDSLFDGVGGDMSGRLPDTLCVRLDGVVSWILAQTGAPG